MFDFGALPPEVGLGQDVHGSWFVVGLGCRVGLEQPCRWTAVGGAGLQTTISQLASDGWNGRLRRPWQARCSRRSPGCRRRPLRPSRPRPRLRQP